MARRLYTLLFYLLLPVIIVRLLYRAWRLPIYAQRWRQRFGWFGAWQLEDSLWLHCVSVGEFMAAKPLIDALLERYPNLPLLVTTMTPTGSERVQQQYGDRVSHVYLPYDLPGPVRRLLRCAKPRLLIIMETELWPNLIHGCDQAGVPVLVANARLSARSARGYQRIRALAQPMLQCIDGIAAQTPADAERFQALGVRSDALTVMGNIKFDVTVNTELSQRAQTLRDAWGRDRRIIIAASTHEGEEAVILRAYARLKSAHPNALLVVVPRHPERFDRVAALIEQHAYRYVRRSQQTAVDRETPVDREIDVLLGDTMGELLLLFGASDVAFVGGSLIERGGHNVLEPLAMGVPVLSGPSVYNFQAISDALRQADVLTMVEDEQTLVSAVNRLWAETVDGHTETQQAWSQKATAVMRDNGGALHKLMATIEALTLPA